MSLSQVITTARLSLPLWEARDVAALRGEVARSPQWHPEFPRPEDVDAATLWVEGDAWGPRSIVRGVTVLGSVGFFGPPEPAADGVAEVEVGYGLVAEARGWGFATEALMAMVGAAEALGVRVRASVAPDNKASIRVLAKGGFTQLRGANDAGELVMVRPLEALTKPVTTFEFRATTTEDWQRLRHFRLENAREDPIGYGATEEMALAFTEADWRMRAERGQGPDSCCYVAIESRTGRWVAMMQSQIIDAEITVTGVYVTPQFRGKRHQVAARLLGGVLRWAATQQASYGDQVVLWVYEGSIPARRFYAHNGFVETGETKPVELDPRAGAVLKMVRPTGS